MTQPMRTLTICNPYPELILLNEKPVENRTWETSYRGQLFIHAGLSKSWMGDGFRCRFPDLPYGAIVGVANLAACLEVRSHTWPPEFAHLKGHEHADGPWCWVLAGVRRFKRPVPCRGSQGIWFIEHLKQDRELVIASVLEQLTEAA